MSNKNLKETREGARHSWGKMFQAERRASAEVWRWELSVCLRSSKEACVPGANGGQGNPGGCDLVLKGRGTHDLEQGGGVEGELGGFRMHFALCAAPWAFSLPPIPGALLPLCWAQSFLPVLVSHPQPLGEESTVSGLTAQQPAGEEAPSCVLAPVSCN